MKKSRPPEKAAGGQKAGSSQGPEDAALWQHVTRGVRPLARKKAGTGPKKISPAPKARPASLPEKTLPPPPRLAGNRPPAMPPPARPAKPGAGFDRATETRLKKGRLDIEARIDLHGMTQAEAHAALGRFIRASENAGRRTLLVITGKGRLGGGVLRRALPLWLEEADFGSSVLAITPARPKDGGDGAFYIRLRKPKN